MDIYRMRAGVLKALAHPDRLRIYDLLSKEGEYCVCELAERLDIKQPMTSKHVALMRDAGLLQSRREGSMVYYFVTAVCLMDIFSCLDRSISGVIKRQQDAFESLADSVTNPPDVKGDS